MMETVNYNKVATCPFCEHYPTLREFNTEPSYLFCENEDCPIYDIRIELNQWDLYTKSKSESRIENRIWQKNTQILVWVLSWIPFAISLGGILLSKEQKPFIFLLPIVLIETYLTTMLVWRTK
jgi:hypothetical protein